MTTQTPLTARMLQERRLLTALLCASVLLILSCWSGGEIVLAQHGQSKPGAFSLLTKPGKQAEAVFGTPKSEGQSITGGKYRRYAPKGIQILDLYFDKADMMVQFFLTPAKQSWKAALALAGMDASKAKLVRRVKTVMEIRGVPGLPRDYTILWMKMNPDSKEFTLTVGPEKE